MRFPSSSVIGPLLVVIACGGAPDEGLFGEGANATGGPGAAGGGAVAAGGSAASAAASSGGSGTGGGLSTGGGGGIGQPGTDGGGLPPADGGSTGGSGAAAGMAGMGGTIEPIGPPGAGVVRCGEARCHAAAGESCCTIQPSPTFINPNPAPEASCIPSGESCGGDHFRCDADNDCPSGEVCCMFDEGQFSSSLNSECRQNCEGARALGCSEPSDCEGRICCGIITTDPFAPSRYEQISCQEICQDTEQCAVNDDCGSGTMCQQSTLLPPGFTSCQ